MNRISIFLLLTVALYACSNDKSDKKHLPRATGKPGDMIIIMDSTQWNGPLGKQIKSIFRASVPGLPQEEPMFQVVFVHPANSIKLLTQVRSLVYVFTLDKTTSGSKLLQKSITPETTNKILTDTSFYLSTVKDEFSRGQEVMYLFGATEDQLIHHLKKNGQNIIDYFNVLERKRLTASLLSSKSTKGLTSFLQKENQCELRLPVGYTLADKQKDFIWFRQIDANMDKDVFITWKPYTSEFQLLPDSIIYWRDEVAQKYLYEDPEKPETFLTTEKEHARVYARQMLLNKNFAMEVRGMWRTNTKSMGGSFVGYALIDQPRGLMYYIEGFAYAPGRNKREIIRELETILWSFRTSGEITKSK